MCLFAALILAAAAPSLPFVRETHYYLNFAAALSTLITDEYSTPIIADDFARVILHSVEKNLKGLYHAAPHTQITRYDFCQKLAQNLGLNQELIIPVTSKELGRDVMTGFNKCLDSNKMAKTGFQFMTLDESFSLIK